VKPLTPEERRTIRQRISAALANLGEFRLFWSPRHRRILARSVAVGRHFRVPDGAVLVGTFAHGIPTRDVLADLEETLAQLPGRN
jgi:hypothetical protein